MHSDLCSGMLTVHSPQYISEILRLLQFRVRERLAREEVGSVISALQFPLENVQRGRVDGRERKELARDWVHEY